ncbi:MAG: methyltransferase domain-containing protein [Thermoleophilia bacterium]|nr:methyltransferase domain-containing protein [Thermoleophilia bacterium]
MGVDKPVSHAVIVPEDEHMTNPPWLWDEIRQMGTDYADPEEVRAYDTRMTKLRDVPAECTRILAKLDLARDAVLVEVGTGTGAFARTAARHCEKVIALDVSPAMLAYARKQTMGKAGFCLQLMAGGHVEPGVWLKSALVEGRPDSVPVDLIVPDGAAPAEGRRGIRLGPVNTSPPLEHHGAEGLPANLRSGRDHLLLLAGQWPGCASLPLDSVARVWHFTSVAARRAKVAMCSSNGFCLPAGTDTMSTSCGELRMA